MHGWWESAGRRGRRALQRHRGDEVDGWARVRESEDALRPSSYERTFIIVPLHRKNMSLCKELCALRSGYNYR
jgi:hypothetical protein